MLSAPGDRRLLFVLEMERGGFTGQVGHFRKMLPSRLEVIKSFTVEQALSWPPHQKAARFMFVCATAKMLADATRSLPELGGEHWRSVYFKSLPDLVEGEFSGGWLQADGSTVSVV